MQSSSGQKASSVVSAVSWLAIIVTVIMVTLWYANSFRNDKLTLERVENDLSNIRKMIDDACEISYYNAEYNPGTKEGALDINGTDVCIQSGIVYRCKKPLCHLPELALSPYHADLNSITKIVLTMSEGRLVISEQ